MNLICSENSQNYEIFNLCAECAIFKFWYQRPQGKFSKLKTVRVLLLTTNWSSVLYKRKKKQTKIPACCLQISKFFVHFIRFSIYSDFCIIFPIRVVAYWTSSFWIASDKISFWVSLLFLFELSSTFLSFTKILN